MDRIINVVVPSRNESYELQMIIMACTGINLLSVDRLVDKESVNAKKWGLKRNS